MIPVHWVAFATGTVIGHRKWMVSEYSIFLGIYRYSRIVVEKVKHEQVNSKVNSWKYLMSK